MIILTLVKEMEYYLYQPGMNRFENNYVQYSAAPLSKSAYDNTRHPALNQIKRYAMYYPSGVCKHVIVPYHSVVPYAKYRVLKRYSNSTKSVFVAKALYHRVLHNNEKSSCPCFIFTHSFFISSLCSKECASQRIPFQKHQKSFSGNLYVCYTNRTFTRGINRA